MGNHFYIPPKNLSDEIDQLEQSINDFINGKIDAVSIKAVRVPFGIYEQRTSGTYMIRVRCPAGIITPKQFAESAKIAKAYNLSRIHVTTRGEFQIHGAKIEQLVPILRELLALNLSSRGGGGNTVRNILTFAEAGTDHSEFFDVTPHVIAVTEALTAETESWKLPRKYKIAFTGDPRRTEFAATTDLGFIAKIENGVRGFELYAAGGLGARPAPGKPFIPFVPEQEIVRIARAIRSLFSDHGNRKNRHAARLRFLWEKIGEEEFHRLFNEALAKEPAISQPIEFTPIENKNVWIGTPSGEISDGFELWKSTYVREQVQEDLHRVTIPLRLGDIESETAIALGEFFNSFGDNSFRFTLNQNIQLRNIPSSALPDVHRFLQKLIPVPVSIEETVVPCAGADTCKLGVCLSRGAADALIDEIVRRKIPFTRERPAIHLSGCPNSCGQHYLAPLGFSGTALRNDGRLYPAYGVFIGGGSYGGKAVLGEKIGEISARDLPNFVADFLEIWQSGVNELSFADFLRTFGKGIAQKLIEDKYKTIPPFRKDRNYYYDWESDDLFSLAGRSSGECSAGIFDFIERDQKIIDGARKALAGSDSKQELLATILEASVRMLLVTRGEEIDSPVEASAAFNRHFVENGLVSKEKFGQLISLNGTGSEVPERLTLEFASEVESLYSRMNDNFSFKDSEPPVQPQKVIGSEPIQKDLRGVACPLNFVKTKLELTKLESGAILEILLDDGEPIKNVPGSVRGEGHEVLEEVQIGTFWKVTIKKK